MSHHRRRKLHKSISCQLFKTILHVEYLLYDVPMFILDVKKKQYSNKCSIIQCFWVCIRH